MEILLVLLIRRFKFIDLTLVSSARATEPFLLRKSATIALKKDFNVILNKGRSLESF